MPRPKKQARLELRSRSGARAVYYILDGSKRISTGCGADQLQDAEIALGRYLAQREIDTAKNKPMSKASVAEALTYYLQRHVASGEVKDKDRIRDCIKALAPFWRDKKISDVSKTLCKDYLAFREGQGIAKSTVGRELGALKSALRFYWSESKIDNYPPVWTPQQRKSKAVYLTREEATKLVWTAIRPKLNSPQENLKSVNDKSRHLARFILLGLYTGTRKEAILSLQWEPNETGGWVDLDAGIIYRLPEDGEETKKRRTPVKIPTSLRSHLRRWRRLTNTHVIEFKGKPVKSIKTSWNRVVRDAEIKHCTPHSLRHTSITWAMQAGAELNEVQNYFGVSRKVLEEVYWHHHPDFGSSVIDSLTNRRRKRS